MQKSSNYLQNGLSTAEARRLLKLHGPNEIKSKKQFTALKILLAQFTSFLVLILIFAGGLSIFLDELVDGLAIFIIVIVNAIIGFIQEYKAENAVQALKKMVVAKTVVLRDGQQQEIPIIEIVPGDLIILAEGEKIPADLEIIEAFSLKVDESMLTGESVAVSKKPSLDKDGQLFKGTIITTGHAKAKVIATGAKTEFGKIVDLVSQQEETHSPLKIQLDDLGKKLAILTLILISILFAIGTLKEISIVKMLMVSVALGVSAIPEGMPIIVTLTLAIGVQILAKKHAIVRKMNAIETLGATTVICSDKTGTLTLNEMTVKKVYCNFNETKIPGHGYEIDKADKIKMDSPEEKLLLEICENCNNAYVDKNILGDPTEIALKILTRKADYIKAHKELDENVFTSERKMMSSLHEKDKKKIIYVKGAFEMIIKNTTHIFKDGKVKKITTEEKKILKEKAEEYAKEALRVLAFAYKPYKNKFDEKDLIFVGLTAMLDPPRKTVKQSIKLAQEAHIQIKIITGDNALTAKAVGEYIGLPPGKILTGDEIDQLSDAKLKQAIYETNIFARTRPEHKYRIVDILQKNHEVVAVTGDGVNDAPAIKHADVGVAMGIKGTEATKEVADIVLKDDNFTTIVTTIEEGRRIYLNILAFIKYMLAANFGSIFTVAILTFGGFALPLLPLQILWINVATDSLPALALGQSPAPPSIMKEKPHRKKENIFKKFSWFIFVAVIFQVTTSLILYFYGLKEDAANGIDTESLHVGSHARTLVFTQIVLFELLFVFACKDERINKIKSILKDKYLLGAVVISLILQLLTIYHPLMQKVFKTVPLTLTEWGMLVLLSLTALFVPKVTNLAKSVFSSVK